MNQAKIHKHYIIRIRTENGRWEYIPAECRTERSAFITLAAVMCSKKAKFGEVLSYATVKERDAKLLCSMERRN